MKHEPDGPVRPNHSCLFWEARTISRLAGRLTVILSLPSQSRHLSPCSVPYNKMQQNVSAAVTNQTSSAAFISGNEADLENQKKRFLNTQSLQCIVHFWFVLSSDKYCTRMSCKMTLSSLMLQGSSTLVHECPRKSHSENFPVRFVPNCPTGSSHCVRS